MADELGSRIVGTDDFGQRNTLLQVWFYPIFDRAALEGEDEWFRQKGSLQGSRQISGRPTQG